METTYKNRNRGCQQLRVCQDAIELYWVTCRVFRQFPYELKRVASQAIASNDSVHRNIAEGLERKLADQSWNDALVIKETNVIYGSPEV